MTSGIDTVETGFPGLNMILGDQLVSSLWLCAWRHAHLKAVQLSSWGRSCSLDSYSLPAQLRVSKFCVAEDGVYWCSHKTGKNCHSYGDKWWLDPIDRCFFKGTSTVFSDNLNISQFCLLTFLCPGWNSYSLEPWAEVPIAQSFQPRYSWDVEWCQPIHWADLNSVVCPHLPFPWSSFSHPYITIFSFKLKILLPREQAWSQAPLISGHATKRSCKAVSQTQLHWRSIS